MEIKEQNIEAITIKTLANGNRRWRWGAWIKNLQFSTLEYSFDMQEHFG